ncbi:hypothetical protein ACWM35_12480 [Neobacillus sp. K501]
MSFEVVATVGLSLRILKGIASLAFLIFLILLIFKKNRKKSLKRLLITVLVLSFSTWGEEKMGHYIFESGLRPKNDELAKYLKDYIQEKQDKQDQKFTVAQPPRQLNPTEELGKVANILSVEEETSSEPTEKIERKEMMDQIVDYNGKYLSLGADLDEILDLLGQPLGDNPNGNGFDIEYDGLILHFTFNDSSNYDYHDSVLTEIIRCDIFKTKQEVLSYLGEPDEVGFDQDLNMEVIKYIIDHHIIRAFVTTDNELFFNGIGLSMPGE